MRILFLLLTVCVSFAKSNLLVVGALENTGLVTANDSGFAIYNNKSNHVTIYSYQCLETSTYEIGFLQQGELIDYILCGSSDDYYLFSSHAKKIYKTDKKFNLQKSLLLSMDNNSKFSNKFYQNNLQNLIFWDKKNYEMISLVQNKLGKLWSLDQNPQDIAYFEGKFYYISSGKLKAKDEKSIEYRSMNLPENAQKIAIDNKSAYCVTDKSIYTIDLSTNNLTKNDISLPECSFIISKNSYLLYGTIDKIYILKKIGE